MNATGPNGPIGMDVSHSDGDEVDGNEEAREENEANLVGLCSGEETEYMDSSDIGSYEIDSDGDVISKKTDHVFFYSSTAHPRFELGMIFENSQQFKDALYAYAGGHIFNFKFVFNKKEKVRVVCKGKGCPYVVHASRDKSAGCFKVKTLVTDHNCSVAFKNSRANYKFVGKHFISKLRILPTLRLWDYVNALRVADVEVGRDCNNQIFHITWAWVLNNLQHDLRLGDGDGCTLPSDMHKGLLEEVPLCFVKIEHRFCARHMYANWRKVHEGVCVILYKEEPLEQYVIGLYLKQKYQELYSVVLPTVANEQFWKDGGMGKIDPPLLRKMPGRPKHKRRREECEVEDHGPSPTPSAPPSSQTSHVSPSSEIPSAPSSQTSHVPPSSQISTPPSFQTSHVPPSSQIPYTPQSTPTMVFMPTPSIQQFSKIGQADKVKFYCQGLTQASSKPDATATILPKARLPKMSIKRHPLRIECLLLFRI
ncbi:hypothetical protein V6N13_098303 [Hibiscus sabdariffa]